MLDVFGCVQTREEAMPRVERKREILTGALSPAYLEQKSADGWKPVAVVWERDVEDGRRPEADIAEDIPYGLKVSEDCVQLEQDIDEKEALLAMLEMIIQDKP